MIKDFFQQSQESLMRLRSEYFRVNDYLEKGQHHMKLSFFNQGKQHYDFDLNSQQYFHQHLDDIIFQKPQIQEDFYEHYSKFLQSDLNINSQRVLESSNIEQKCQVHLQNNIKSAKQKLILHFQNRLSSLQHKKYLTILRFHNNIEPNTGNLKLLETRIKLIDSQIQSTLNRLSRLKSSDEFQLNTNKPVPVNENDNATYKILDDEESSYTNISRDDIEIYMRANGYQYNILEIYWKYYYSLKHISLRYGLDIVEKTENAVHGEREKEGKIVREWCQKLVGVLEKNMVQSKVSQGLSLDAVTILLQNLYGLNSQQPFLLPLTPSLSEQLIININDSMKPYFTLQVCDFNNLYDLVPKLVNFVSILFRYQNKDITIQEQQDIKLGLEDDIDLQKELLTLLELSWVNKYVKLHYSKYNIKIHLNKFDFGRNQAKSKRAENKPQKQQFIDIMTREIIKSTDINNYNAWRNYIKTHSESIVSRAPNKFKDFEKCKQYQVHSSSDITLAYLNKLYHTKAQPELQQDKMKKVDRQIYESLMEKLAIKNSVFVEAYLSMYSLHIRDIKSTLRNVLNGKRCYYKRLQMDLRTINKTHVDHQCEDRFLIDTNKQQRDNMDKLMKMSPNTFSLLSLKNNGKGITSEDEIEYQLSQHSIYSYDKISSVYFQDEQIPQLYVTSSYRSQKYILYDIVLRDLETVEQRVLETVSKFISKFQGYVKVNGLDPLVDRYRIIHEIYELELKFEYEKFKQLEILMQIYEHQVNPLNSSKLVVEIFQLMDKTPRVDCQQCYFLTSYQKQIQILKQKSKILQKAKYYIEKQQIIETNKFHQRLSKSISLPYYNYGMFYQDLDPDKVKRPRKQSHISQLSFTKNNVSSIRKRITSNDIVEEDSEQQDEQSDDIPFNLKNYDEYLLTKDLEQVFDQIVGVRVEVGVVDGREEVNEVNKNIHRKAEGGPHFLMKLDRETKLKLPTGKKVQFLNFFENISWSINIFHLLNQEYQKIVEVYCKNKRILYELNLQSILLQTSLQILCKEPIFKTTLINTQINWDESYHLVTKSSKKYREIMINVFQPPSSLTTAFSLPKIIDALPDFSELQYIDIHTLDSILTLNKPNNVIMYRQLSLAINLIEVFNLSDKINHAIYEREMISRIYKQLGKLLGIEVATNIMQYVKEVGLVIEQLKPVQNFQSNFLFPDAVEKLRLVCEAELTNVQNFLSFVKYHQKKVRNVLLLEREMKMFAKHKCYYLNGIIDEKRITLELTNIKNLVSRVKPMIGAASSHFKQLSYLNSKRQMLLSLQQQFSKSHLQFEDKTAKQQKYLLEKKLWLIKQKLMLMFYKDMQRTTKKRMEFLECIEYNELLNQKSHIYPLGKLFFSQQQHSRFFEQKFYYDQRQPQKQVKPYGALIAEGKIIVDPFYLSSIQQMYSEFSELQQPYNLNNFNIKEEIQRIEQEWKVSKSGAYDKMLPTLALQQPQLSSLNYICQLNQCISGQPTIYNNYKQDVSSHPEISHQRKAINNKSLEYYHALDSYINVNILQISLSCQDISILNQITTVSKDFDTMYPLIDPNQLYQNFNNNVISAMYIYEVREYQILKKAKTNSSSQTIVIDELTDFFIRRVQGLGLIRQLFLPFIEELKSFGKEFYLKDIKEAIEFLKIKTRNIHKLIYLGMIESMKYSKDREFLEKLMKLYELMYNPYYSEKSAKYLLNVSSSEINNNLFESNKFNKKKRKQNKDILNKLSHSLTITPINFHKYTMKYISQAHPCYNFSHPSVTSVKNKHHITDTLTLLSSLGQTNRLKLLSNLKHIHQSKSQILLLKKPTNWISKQLHKQTFFNMLIQTSNFISSIVNLKQICLPESIQQYQLLSSKQFQQIQSRTLTIVTSYQQYITSNKLILTTQEKNILKTPIPISSKQWSYREQDIYRILLKKVITNKLVKQQFKVTLINSCNTLLEKERIPINQPTKVVNINLVPRVKLNNCYSSPLRQEKNTYISNSHKIAFIQSFINRLRNKVSRVDLLSSGYGFVITVADLENCVNFLNKSLFSFTEKQFKYRMDTFGLYWEMMIEALNIKNKEITELKSKLQYLKGRADNINETAFIKKASNLLSENTKLNARIQEIEKLSNGLEDRMRKVVEIKYHTEIEEIKKQNEMLKGKFKQFQQLLVSLAKDETKKSLVSLVSQFKSKTSDLLHKNIDIDVTTPSNAININNLSSQSFKPASQSSARQSSSSKPKQKSSSILQQLEQDSYYQSKIINKMRVFNTFKLSVIKQKSFREHQKLKKQITQLRSVHDTNIVKNQKQLLIRKQLDNIQIVLLNKIKQLQTYRAKCEFMENENDKLKTWKTNKEKVIQNLKNSVLERSIYQPYIKQEIVQERTMRSDAKSQRIPSPRKSFSLQKQQQKQREPTPAKISTKMFGTQPLLLQTSYQLSNKEVSWKQKCQELYMENKKLEKNLEKMKIELVKLRSIQMIQPVQEEIIDVSQFSREQLPSRSNIMSYQKTLSSKRQRFPNINFKYKMMGHDT